MKLFTVHGALALSSWMPMSPTLVEMVALISGGSVGSLPDRGGLTGLTDGSCEAGYSQSAPRSAGGANAGNGGAGTPGPPPPLRATVWARGLEEELFAAGT